MKNNMAWQYIANTISDDNNEQLIAEKTIND